MEELLFYVYAARNHCTLYTQ